MNTLTDILAALVLLQLGGLLILGIHTRRFPTVPLATWVALTLWPIVAPAAAFKSYRDRTGLWFGTYVPPEDLNLNDSWCWRRVRWFPLITRGSWRTTEGIATWTAFELAFGRGLLVGHWTPIPIPPINPESLLRDYLKHAQEPALA